MPRVALLSETFTLSISGLPHSAVGIYTQAARFQINTAVRTTRSILAAQQFFKQEIKLNQGFPPHFPGRNLITTGARFCSHTNSAHDNPPSYGISLFASFTLPTSPASSLGARGCRKGGMLQKLPSVSKRLNKIRG